MTRQKKKNGAKGLPESSASRTRGAGSSKGSSGAFGGRSGQQAAVAIGQQIRNVGPRFSANGRSLKVSHREFAFNVLGNTAFTVGAANSLNPARYYPFPWLSGIARKFESYMFHSLRFIYVPSCPTSTKGSVLMTIDYDAADAGPTTGNEFLQCAGAVKGPCWQEVVLQADPEYLGLGGRRRFTRHSGVPAGTDIKTYDAGNLWIAVDGQIDLTAIGDVFVEYVVELFVPQPNPEIELEESCKIAASAASVAKNTPLGDLATSVVTGLLEVATSADKIWVKQPGQYKIDYSLLGTGLNTTAPDTSASAAVVSSTTPLATGDGLSSRGTVWANVTDPSRFISLKFPTVTTVSSMTARLAPYAYALL